MLRDALSRTSRKWADRQVEPFETVEQARLWAIGLVDWYNQEHRQGEVLLVVTRFFLSDSHPLNIDFVLSLPEELQPHFNAWCESRHSVPQDLRAFR